MAACCINTLLFLLLADDLGHQRGKKTKNFIKFRSFFEMKMRNCNDRSFWDKKKVQEKNNTNNFRCTGASSRCHSVSVCFLANDIKTMMKNWWKILYIYKIHFHFLPSRKGIRCFALRRGLRRRSIGIDHSRWSGRKLFEWKTINSSGIEQELMRTFWRMHQFGCQMVVRVSISAVVCIMQPWTRGLLSFAHHSNRICCDYVLQ